jgi:hypothetical protein
LIEINVPMHIHIGLHYEWGYIIKFPALNLTLYLFAPSRFAIGPATSQVFRYWRALMKWHWGCG